MKIKRTIILMMLMQLSFLLLPQVPENTNQGRDFMLIFDVVDYHDHLNESVAFFFNTVLQEGDRLSFRTPIRHFNVPAAKLSADKDGVLKVLTGALEEDIKKKKALLKPVFDDMRRISDSILSIFNSNSSNATGYGNDPRERRLENAYKEYHERYDKMIALRGNYEDKMVKAAEICRKRGGKNNHMVVFLQRQYIPVPSKSAMGRRKNNMKFGSTSINNFYERDKKKEKVDIRKLKLAFKYSGITCHFLFIKGENKFNTMSNNKDLFKVFTKIAKATNGVNSKSLQPEEFFKQVNQLLKTRVSTKVVGEKIGDDR